MLSYEERIDRILDASHIVRIEDSTIHVVDSVERLGSVIFVNTGTGLLFQDLDVFTLQEACDAERFLRNIKQELNIK